MSGRNGELELLSGVGRKEDVSKRFDITYDRRGLKQGSKQKSRRSEGKSVYNSLGLIGTQDAELTPLTEVNPIVIVILGGLGIFLGGILTLAATA
jgi:hypothetical protein